MGYQLIAITADRPSKFRETIDEHDLTFQVYSDSAMTAAAAFGIAFHLPDMTREAYASYGIDLAGAAGMDHGILPVPALFVVDTSGMIRFQYVNPDHRVRLDEEVVLSVAKAMMAQMSN